MKIYFAGPLFNEAEKSFNLRLTEKLEKLNHKVFLPQRDGIEKNKAPYNELSPEKIRELIFETDRDEILSSDIFLFILDGRVPDEGACVELGIAYSNNFFNNKNIILIGLQTDSRSTFLNSKLNPMIKVPLDYIFDNTQDFLNFIKTL
ncbi:MAG: nucleoside 2-deoxyribosyltransferase [Candidatus Gracilibacteria bacterium]|nr:nucleoside 2-deoxyribosyltransferase [Candidatus Gracilibacteria bacterium]